MSSVLFQSGHIQSFLFFFVDSYHTVAAETLLEQFLHVEEDNSFGVLSSKW